MEIILYDEGSADELNLDEIARYLPQKMGRVGIEARENPFANLPEDRIADYARRIASSKIQQADQRIRPEQAPLHGEIEYEQRRILGKTKAFGILYDGVYLDRIFGEAIPRDERRFDLVHIIFTNRLLATWDDGDRRYHLRTSLYGFPSVISTTGLVEAPAKPREYYLLKQQYEKLGKDLTELKEKFAGRFIDYGDKRLTEVVKGYVMQAISYALTGEPFCPDKGCRLYNAHWQEELIFAQLESGYEFCRRHAELLNRGITLPVQQ